MPRNQLACEFAALGLDQVRIATLTGSANYAAAFRAARPRPEPGAIKPCKADRRSSRQDRGNYLLIFAY